MFEIKRLRPDEWATLSEDAHLAMFSERRPGYIDRIDFALLATEDDNRGIVGYVTVRELDADGIYWQYGGAFPSIKTSTTVLGVYRQFVEYCKARYKRITTLVENTNIAYLKLAMKVGFRIIGVRVFKGSVLVELLLDFEVNDALPI